MLVIQILNEDFCKQKTVVLVIFNFRLVLVIDAVTEGDAWLLCVVIQHCSKSEGAGAWACDKEHVI